MVLEQMRRLVFALCAVWPLLASETVVAAEWHSAGQNIANTRNQPDETRIAPDTAARLDTKWVAQLGGDISATPAVDTDSVYVTDTIGRLYRLDRETGEVIWRNPIVTYTGVRGDNARTTPVIAGDLLILGTQGARELFKDGARVIAVDKASGKPVWQTTIEKHRTAVITQSAVVHDQEVFIGVSSWEEYVAAKVPDYDCCGFRGSLTALDVATGALVWKTYTSPEADGYSGNAVWGSTPAIDPVRGLVYATTGNSYSAPEKLLSCLAAAGMATSPADAERDRNANESENYVDAFVAFDIATGDIVWGNPMTPYDAYTVSCFEPEPNPENCPSPKGPDYDFAQGPSLFRVTIDGGAHDLVGAGQKSGIYWALDRDSGAVFWQTKVGPGSALGGMEWGSATDGQRIYVAVSNYAKRAWKLRGNGADAGKRIYHGFWSALDAATGEILWQTADPNVGAPDMGAVTVANGVVFAGSMAGEPKADTMFALDAATGEILWRYASGGSVNGGAAVADGVVYWGSGYRQWGGRSNNKLYAFEVK